MGLHSGNGGLPALPGYIRQRWEWLTVADTMAYYSLATITAIKLSWYGPQWPVKLITAVIYRFS